MHRNIELALGGNWYDRCGVEMDISHGLLSEWLEPRRWHVYRLEWSIYCSNAGVAGQIDALFICDGVYHMVDWKRCSKALDPSDGVVFGRYGHPPFEDCVYNTCNHYFVQQNLYAEILDRRYGIHVESMWLCQIHPNLESHYLVPVPDMRDRAGQVLDEYERTRLKDMPWERATPADGVDARELQ